MSVLGYWPTLTCHPRAGLLLATHPRGYYHIAWQQTTDPNCHQGVNVYPTDYKANEKVKIVDLLDVNPRTVR